MSHQYKSRKRKISSPFHTFLEEWWLSFKAMGSFIKVISCYGIGRKNWNILILKEEMGKVHTIFTIFSSQLINIWEGRIFNSKWIPNDQRIPLFYLPEFLLPFFKELELLLDVGRRVLIIVFVYSHKYMIEGNQEDYLSLSYILLTWVQFFRSTPFFNTFFKIFLFSRLFMQLDELYF